MNNNLPQSLLTRIEKEAEAELNKYSTGRKENNIDTTFDQVAGFADGFTTAATAILSDPGAWNLAGSWVKIKRGQAYPELNYDKSYVVRAKLRDHDFLLSVKPSDFEDMNVYDSAEYLCEVPGDPSPSDNGLVELKRCVLNLIRYFELAGIEKMDEGVTVSETKKLLELL